MAPSYTFLAWSAVVEDESLFTALWDHLLRCYQGAYAPVLTNTTLSPADFPPIGGAPDIRDHNLDEEGEDGGINLDIFNFSLGYQTKVVGQMNSPSSISLINLGAAPP